MGYILKGNRRSSIPQRFIFYDTETYPVRDGDWTENHLNIGSFLYWRQRKGRKDTIERGYFNVERDFWNYVDSKIQHGTRLMLLSHNEDFDFRAVKGFELLPEFNYQQKYLIPASPPFLAKYQCQEKGYKKYKTLSINDTTNYFLRPLADIGEKLGFPKGTMTPWGGPLSAGLKYCGRDTEIVYRLWKKFINFVEKHDFGNLGKTVAAQALNAYRHRFMNYKIYIHRNQGSLKLEDEAYHGGRTEAFRIFEDDKHSYYYLDVNSMYPSVMEANDFPVRRRFSYSNVSVSDLYSWMDDNLVIARVLVKTDKPCLPRTIDNRLCFPVGQFWTSLCTPELKIALEEGKILKVDYVTIYEGQPIFKEWVNELYGIRMEYKQSGEKDFEMMVKTLLNSLYGKFGQCSPQWEKADTTVSLEEGFHKVYNSDTDEYVTYRTIGEDTFRQTGRKLAHHAQKSIPAFVTSYARSLMWHTMKRVGHDNYLYCDTDSLIVNQAGYEAIKDDIDSQALGKWDMEKKINYLNIRGLKDYTIDKKTKLKGIPRDQQRPGKRVYKITMWEHTKGALRRGKITVPRTKEVTKEVKGIYQKGNISKNGWIEPIKLKEV